jgi:pSer/pThr/pTyr-binding forkhead associated (FHA) protein
MAPSSSSAGPRALTLTVIAGPNPGECLSKPGATTLKLGRVKGGNTFSIKSASVSSKHAEIVWDSSAAASGGTWFLVDIGSSNGTQLNGNSKCLERERCLARIAAAAD